MANHDYLNLWGWQPGGYDDALDARAITGAAARNPYAPLQRYTQRAALLDFGDEHFGGNSNAYIPVLIAGYGTIALNMHQTVDNPNPAQQNPPGMRQLTQQLYHSLNGLWQRIRQDTHTDWG